MLVGPRWSHFEGVVQVERTRNEDLAVLQNRSSSTGGTEFEQKLHSFARLQRLFASLYRKRSKRFRSVWLGQKNKAHNADSFSPRS